MYKIYISTLTLSLLLVVGQSRAAAQQVNKKALEKSTFYTAPREFQIIDERPVVKDFREAPPAEGNVDLGSPNAGSARRGANTTIPAGGLPLGSPSQTTRTGSDALPKSVFGSNIPVRGVGGAGNLPTAGNRSYLSGSKPSASLPSAGTHIYGPVKSNRAPAAQPAPTTVETRTYGNYRSTPPTVTSSSRQELKVRGRLLRSK